MTTHATLAETIARLGQIFQPGTFAGDDLPTVMTLRPGDMRTLLLAARRCEATDRKLKLESPGHAPCDSCPEWGVCQTCGHTGYTEAAYLIELEERTSERDALAKRVGELEAKDRRSAEVLDINARYAAGLYTERNKLEAESTRLREENERLAAEVDAWKDASGLLAGGEHGDPDGVTPAASRRYWEKVEADLTAAQDRVRELEGALSATVRALHEHGHKQEASAFYRYLPPLGTTNTPGPITDPTQGVSTVGIDWAVPGSERTMETIIDHTGAVVSCRERPSCIPATCEHFERLPPEGK